MQICANAPQPLAVTRVALSATFGSGADATASPPPLRRFFAQSPAKPQQASALCAPVAKRDSDIHAQADACAADVCPVAAPPASSTLSEQQPAPAKSSAAKMDTLQDSNAARAPADIAASFSVPDGSVPNSDAAQSDAAQKLHSASVVTDSGQLADEAARNRSIGSLDSTQSEPAREAHTDALTEPATHPLGESEHSSVPAAAGPDNCSVGVSAALANPHAPQPAPVVAHAGEITKCPVGEPVAQPEDPVAAVTTLDTADGPSTSKAADALDVPHTSEFAADTAAPEAPRPRDSVAARRSALLDGMAAAQRELALAGGSDELDADLRFALELQQRELQTGPQRGAQGAGKGAVRAAAGSVAGKRGAPGSRAGPAGKRAKGASQQAVGLRLKRQGPLDAFFAPRKEAE